MKDKRRLIDKVVEVDIPNTLDNVGEFINNIQKAVAELSEEGYSDLEVAPIYSTYVRGSRIETKEEESVRLASRLLEEKEDLLGLEALIQSTRERIAKLEGEEG